MSIEEYIEQNWPKDVPKECANININDEDCGDDCIEKELTIACKSCSEYVRLTMEYFKQPSQMIEE